MSLTKSQATIALDRHRFRVINCGRRFGKTTLAVKEIKGKIAAKKKHIVYIAPTYQQARDIAWEMLKKEFIGADFNESRLEMRVGDSVVFLRGWESIETLRGQAFDFIVIDEIAMMRNFWLYWQEVIRPTLTDTQGKVMFISTPKGFNHFYDLYNLELTDNDYKSFHFTSYDNPYLPVEELNKAKQEIPEDRFAQEYLADFRKTEGLVYKEFDRGKHLYDKLPEITILDRLLGIDFGFTNPTAMLLILRDAHGNYYADSEWYKTNQTNDQIIETALSFKTNQAYPDPEAPEKILELNRAGVNCMEVSKGKDSIKNGIDIVRGLLKQGRLRINKLCLNLIWEFETYTYPAKRPDNPNPEIPIKENDHLLDALRYVLQTNKISPELTEAQNFRFALRKRQILENSNK
jgi:PBSX family phage terminase large subunit